MTVNEISLEEYWYAVVLTDSISDLILENGLKTNDKILAHPRIRTAILHRYGRNPSLSPLCATALVRITLMKLRSIFNPRTAVEIGPPKTSATTGSVTR